MRKHCFTISLLVVMSLISFNYSTHAQKNVDYLNEILREANGTIVESGVRANFTIDGNGENISNEVLKKLGYDEKSNINVVKAKNLYRIEFNKENINGYIESFDNENYNIVTLDIINQSKVNNLESIKKAIENSIKDKNVKVRYYQYVKAKIPEGDLKSLNSDITRLLKSHGARNVNTINLDDNDLNRGFSTTAYIGRYEKISTAGGDIDLNYALCNYTSGEYLIIGTPIIYESY